MRHLVPSVAFAGVTGVVLSNVISRDFTIVGASLTGAMSYILVAYSLWPLIMGKRRSVLAPGLFGISIFGSLLFVYGPMYIALGRPEWFFAGLPFNLYIACYGGLIASIASHLISLGHTQQKTKLYMGLFALFISLSFAISTVLWWWGYIL